jgi:hypothetical protein
MRSGSLTWGLLLGLALSPGPARAECPPDDQTPRAVKEQVARRLSAGDPGGAAAALNEHFEVLRACGRAPSPERLLSACIYAILEHDRKKTSLSCRRYLAARQPGPAGDPDYGPSIERMVGLLEQPAPGPPPQPVRPVTVAPRLPSWSSPLLASGIAIGGTLATYGVLSLALDGRCLSGLGLDPHDADRCPALYDLGGTPLGTAAVGVGIALAVVPAIALSIHLGRKNLHR